MRSNRSLPELMSNSVHLLVVAALAISGCSDEATRDRRARPLPSLPNEYDGWENLGTVEDGHSSSQWAIIVGINDYSNGWSPLRTAVNDAVNVRNMIRDEFGYSDARIRLLLNVDAATITSTLRDVIADGQVSSQDSILFYFAGHGTSDGRLAGVDSKPENADTNGISLVDIGKWLNASRFLRKAIILDSCFSGKLFEASPPTGRAGEAKGVFVGLSAARASAFAFDGSNDADFSPFTKHLLDVLRERANSQQEDHTFNFDRLADEVRTRVSKESSGAQVPKWGFLGPGQGEFVFRESLPRPTPLEQERMQKMQLRSFARIQRLIGSSKDCRETHPQRSLLLAVEAVGTVNSDKPLIPEAHQNLRDALGAIGGVPLIRHTGGIHCWANTPNGRWLFTAGGDKIVRAWDLASSTAQSTGRVIVKHLEPVEDIAVSPNGAWMASASQDGTVQIVKLNEDGPSTANTVQTRLHNEYVTNVAFSHDGHWLASASLEGIIRLWNLSDGTVPQFPIRLRAPSGKRWGIRELEFTRDSHYLIAATLDKTTCLWPIAKFTSNPRPIILTGHQDSILCLAVSTDSRWAATGGADGLICLWSLDSTDPGSDYHRLTGHTGMVNSLAFTPDGKWLVSGCSDTTSRVWTVSGTNSKTSQVLSGHTESISSVAVSTQGDLVATGSQDGTVRLWDLTARDPVSSGTVLRGHESGVHTVCFTPDDKMVLSAASDHAVRQWPAVRVPTNSAAVLFDISNRSSSVETVSRTGTWLASEGNEGICVLRRLTSGVVNYEDRLRICEGITEAAFSEDEKWLVVGGDDGSLKLFNLTHASPLAMGINLPGHMDSICRLVFSPDGRWLVSTSLDNKGQVWDLSLENPATNAHMLPLAEVDKLSVDFLRDSTKLVAYGVYAPINTARIWTLNDMSKPPVVLASTLRARSDWQFAHRRWLIATDGRDSAIIWDTSQADPAAGQCVITLPQKDIVNAAVSPDDKWLVLGTGSVLDKEHMVWLYDISSGHDVGPAHRLPGHASEVQRIVFDHRCQHMATGAHDKTIRVWDLTSSDLVATCKVLEDVAEPLWLDFSTDDRWLVSGGRDQSPRLWDLQSPNRAKPVVFTGYRWISPMPDPKWLLCGGRCHPPDENLPFGRRVREVQALDIGYLVEIARRIADRDFTEEEKRLFTQD
jgi:WD40 repeat protein